MMQGKLIVLEGIDGSGKSTQYRRLCERLENDNRSFRKVSFPRYDRDSSALIRAYLSGAYGSKPEDVNAYAASTLYAVDRFASYRDDWGEYYRNGGLILMDRYTTSNACHQGSKVPIEQRQQYLDWLYSFEFGLLELPKPDLVIYLDVELSVSLHQMEERNAEKDIHERDTAYLESCLEAGRYAAAHYGWNRISCVKDGAMRSVEDISEEIYTVVQTVV